MGAGESHHNEEQMKNFKIQKYLNQGLNQQQILKIKEAFESYEPTNGRVESEKLKNCTRLSGSKDEISQFLEGKDSIDFDEFFMMSKHII